MILVIGLSHHIQERFDHRQKHIEIIEPRLDTAGSTHTCGKEFFLFRRKRIKQFFLCPQDTMGKKSSIHQRLAPASEIYKVRRLRVCDMDDRFPGQIRCAFSLLFLFPGKSFAADPCGDPVHSPSNSFQMRKTAANIHLHFVLHTALAGHIPVKSFFSCSFNYRKGNPQHGIKPILSCVIHSVDLSLLNST